MFKSMLQLTSEYYEISSRFLKIFKQSPLLSKGHNCLVGNYQQFAYHGKKLYGIFSKGF